MPMYKYICPKCGNKDWDIRTIPARNDPFNCEKCESKMERDFTVAPHVSGGYANPIVSDAMAVSVDQIDEHKKMFPDVQVTSEGQPVMENYRQHEAYLKKVGFVKHPGKTKI